MRVPILYMVIWLANLLAPWASYGSDFKQKQSTLYPFSSTIEYQDDFLQSSLTGYFSVFNGATTNPGPLINRPGLLRRDTTAVINTVAGLSLGSAGTTIDPDNNFSVLWVLRLNTNDANTLVRIGLLVSPVSAPPADGYYFEKLDADTNWFCVTRAGGVQTRTDSTIAVSTNFTTFIVGRNSTGTTFSINNTPTCGTITTNQSGVEQRPSVQIINSAAAAKTLDVDYFQIRMSVAR